MKKFTRNALFLSSIFFFAGATLRASEEPELITNFTQGTADTVTLESQDGTKFTVDDNLAETFGTIDNLIKDAGRENAIPLPNVTAKTLSRLLLFAQGLRSAYWDEEKNDYFPDEYADIHDYSEMKDARLNDYIDLVAAANYLDAPKILTPIVRALVENMSFQAADLVAVLSGSSNSIPHDIKVMIIKELAKTAPIENLDILKSIYANIYLLEALDLRYRLLLIKELIKNDRALLSKIVGFWAVHYKEVRDRGGDPMMTNIRRSKTTQRERELETFIKALLDNHYQLIEQMLKEEYPTETEEATI